MALQFKVDEDLPRDVADVLRAAGHGASTVVEQGIAGTPDEALWSFVQQERRCLVTADKGFANAQLHPPGAHAGIVLFRLQRECRNGYIHLARQLVSSGKIDSLTGAIAVVTPDAIRIHRTR